MANTPMMILFDLLEKGSNISILKEQFLILEYANQKVIYVEGMKALQKSIEDDQYRDFDDYYKRNYGTPPVSESNS